jgi:hypothetical protein
MSLPRSHLGKKSGIEIGTYVFSLRIETAKRTVQKIGNAYKAVCGSIMTWSKRHFV